MVLRKRATLEAGGLLDEIAADIHPEPGLVADPHRFNALDAWRDCAAVLARRDLDNLMRQGWGG